MDTVRVVINPGTGPVACATEDYATANISALLIDAGVEGATIERVPQEDDAGRFAFLLKTDKGRCSVDMPGLPLERVRYLGTGGQNIWEFPRLYVDGSSWVWKYAISFVGNPLKGIKEDD